MKKLINDNLLDKNRLIYIDIGASGGVIPKWHGLSDNFTSILFEPNIEAYNALKIKKKKNEVVVNTALSNKTENLKINICEEPQSSSFYHPNRLLLDKYYNSNRFNITGVEQLKTNTLDKSLYENRVNDVDFVKIDTQGYELKILEGSNDTLNKLIGVEVECEFTEMYINQPLFGDVFNFLLNKKFSLFDLKRYYWKRKNHISNNENKGQIIFVDALFLKQPEEIIKNFSKNKKKLIKATYIYLYYKYTDLSKIIIDYMISKKMLDKNELDIFNKSILNIDKEIFRFPDFPGKMLLRKIFLKLSNLFLPNSLYSKTYEWKKSSYNGNDQKLGN